MSSTGEQCFSGGVDGTIQCWNTPNPNIDPYDSYGNLACFFIFLIESDDVERRIVKWLELILRGRLVGAAWRAERTHGLGLGFGVQQRASAPPLLLCGRHRETVGCQHHLPCPRSIQRKQTYGNASRYLVESILFYCKQEPSSSTRALFYSKESLEAFNLNKLFPAVMKFGASR